jgi:ADP-heptose:LPS heptosyltransferase
MRHVLAVRLDNEGDVLLTGPAIRALAATADRVTLLCGPSGRHAAALLPAVDEVLVWRAAWIDAHPEPVERADVDSLVAAIAERGIDRAVIFSSFHQSPLPAALLLRLAGVPWVGATSIDYPGTLLDLRHRIHDDVHEVERALDLARAAGGVLPEDDDGRLRVAFDPVAAADLELPESYVVVHPGASVPARAWPAGHCAALVDALLAAGRRVVVTGGPAERELTAEVAGAARAGVTDLGGRTTFAELAAVIAGADCIVVGNTGPAHLAAAVGTPVASPFAPTVPAVRWRPWGVAHELLRRNVPCANCRARACPVPGHPCLSEVGVGEVLAAVERLAGHGARARRETRHPAGAFA